MKESCNTDEKNREEVFEQRRIKKESSTTDKKVEMI